MDLPATSQQRRESLSQEEKKLSTVTWLMYIVGTLVNALDNVPENLQIQH